MLRKRGDMIYKIPRRSNFSANNEISFKRYRGEVISVQTMKFRSKDDKEHLAEKQLKQFAQIHVESCTKF